MTSAANGQNPLSILSALAADDSMRARLVWLTSSVWHEKRHFFDTCLTNHAARQFRDLFTLASNFYGFGIHAQDKKEPLWFPVEVYASKARRFALGLSEPPPELIMAADYAHKIKMMVRGLNEQPVVNGNSIHLGGDAQLEGLAQASQTLCVEECFGPEDLIAVTREFVHRQPKTGPYRILESVSFALGCADENSKYAIVNTNLASALFFTALCGQHYGRGAQLDPDIVAPWRRLSQLLEHLGPRPGRPDMTDGEAADRVDQAAKRLWGRTAFEEIAFDIDGMEERFKDQAHLLPDESLRIVFEEFIGIRRQILAESTAAGPTSVLPFAYASHWRDRLFPVHVIATPGGAVGEPGDKEIVFGRRFNVPPGLEHSVPSVVVWGRVAQWVANRENIGPKTRSAWIEMLQDHAPRAMLMLNGRQHRRIIVPELEAALERIKAAGLEVKIHPQWEWPNLRLRQVRINEAVGLAEFVGRSTLRCDLTGDEISPTQAALVTPWELRNSRLIDQIDQSDIRETIRLLCDWSDWVVREDLLEDG